MATATARPADTHELQRELQIELEKMEAIQRRLDQDNAKLRELNAERARLVGAVGHGNAREGDVLKIDEQIKTVAVRIEGTAPILQKHRAGVDSLQKQIRERQTAAEKAAHQRACDEQIAKVRAAVLQLREIAARGCMIASEVMEGYCELGGKFADVGGIEAATMLREMLVNPSRGMEPLRNPEVHLAQLEREGMIAFGYKFNDRLVPSPIQGVNPSRVVSVVPGEPLRLTIVSMRPKV